MKKITIDPSKVTMQEMYAYMTGAVAPRPIAFASTINKEGHVNLAPFSFFNVFSANPPILIFSPLSRMRDNSSKHTLENVLEVPEVVINIVNYAMVEQMSLASTEYDKNVDEFQKAGFTANNAVKVLPPLVAEAPVAFECKVVEVKTLGKEGGAGNLIICEVIYAHVEESILDEHQAIDPHQLDAVARLGGNWYSRASDTALFEIPKPIRNKGIGVDQLPNHIKQSTVLTGNNLGRLGNIERMPDEASVVAFAESDQMVQYLSDFQKSEDDWTHWQHTTAQKLMEQDKLDDAWLLLLQKEH